MKIEEEKEKKKEQRKKEGGTEGRKIEAKKNKVKKYEARIRVRL